MSISSTALWQRYSTLSYGTLPADVVTVAQQCILDWFACTLAGSCEPLAEILRHEYADVSGPCTLIGTSARTNSKAAALINGATGHALDFDDTNMAMGGHGSVPVFPAVLALAEELGASGAELITAFVVGCEVEGRLGSAIGGKHYAKGWHVTSTMGVFGAAAGAAHLLKLDDTQFGHAMGLAASQASGLKANFGTMTKPFHAGHAAECGLLAARLAAKGFTANRDAFAGKQGLVEAAGAGNVDERRLGALGDDWVILQTLFKYHAACYLTHAAIESTLKLSSRVTAETLAAATVTVHPALLDVCGIECPQTGLEAKFSLTGTTAMALLGIDTANPASFVDATLAGAELQTLIKKVRVETDTELQQTQAVVTLADSAQNTHCERWDAGVPATDFDAQAQKLNKKFLGISTIALSDEDAPAYLGKIHALSELADVRRFNE